MNYPAICDFDLHSNKFSWVNEATQNLSEDADYGNKA